MAVYHRVSTLDQDPTLARRELETWVARQGGHVAMLVEESRGRRLERPARLHRVLEAARREELDVVVVWKLDRWGRPSLDVLSNISALADCSVRFVAVSQGLDVKPSGDAMSRLMITVLAAVAEFERDLIRERTHLGLARARAKGVKLGGAARERPVLARGARTARGRQVVERDRRRARVLRGRRSAACGMSDTSAEADRVTSIDVSRAARRASRRRRARQLPGCVPPTR